MITYTIHLADNALILAQRNAEWCGHGPVLEQDIAITNISLDLIGQARNFYTYASRLLNELPKTDDALPFLSSPGEEVTEDTLAFLRKEQEFRNILLVELPNGDWAHTILKQFFFSAYQSLLYMQLREHRDEQLAAIAAKSLKEVTYHLRWSSEWVIRLGDGTEESHHRMRKATEELWRFTGEMFLPAFYEMEAGVDVTLLQQPWEQKVKEVMAEANLRIPDTTFMQTGGKQGRHTEHMGYILTDLQYMQRTYPHSQW